MEYEVDVEIRASIRVVADTEEDALDKVQDVADQLEEVVGIEIHSTFPIGEAREV